MDLRSLAFKVRFDGNESAVSRMDGATTKLGKQADRTVKKLESMSTSFGKVGKNLTTKVTLPLAGIAAATIKLGADFDDQMSTVQAVTRATSLEMDQLRSQARLMGKDTRYSASEAAAGQENLARAGFTTNEVLSALGDTLNLATTGGMGLAQAAEIAASTIRGFGLEASEAGRVSDVLAYTSSATKVNVEGLGQAFSQVAPVASALSLNIEEMAAATGILGDNAIEGSQAGNMLKRGLLNLSSPTKQQRDTIKQLGMSFFDSNGEIKSMVGIISELEDGLKGMTSQQRTAALSTIFGSEAVSGWTALINAGSESLQGLQTELEGSKGYAQEFADVAEDNLAGSFRSMRSSLEELMLSFYEMESGPVRNLVDGFTNLIDRVSGLDDGTKQMIILAGGFLASIGPIVWVLGKVFAIGGKLIFGISKVIGLVGTVTAFLGKAGFAISAVAGGAATLGEGMLFLMGPVGWAIAGFTALVGVGVAVYKNFDRIKDGWNNLVSAFKKPVKGIVRINSDGLGGSMTPRKVDGSHRSGLSRVPFDGYMAELHKDETVLPKGKADEYRRGETRRRANNIVYSPSVNITVGQDVSEDTKKDLERTIKDVLEREREKFFYKLNLKTT